jgi:putative nucleotidyltransferase with HDIG domain
MNFVDRRERRPIIQALRDSVLEDLPEIAQIAHEELRSKTIEAWAYALSESAFRRVTDIPGEANPGMLRLRRGSQADHLRSVTRIALAIADDFASTFPEAQIDRDIVIAGGMLHDVGKAWEFDPENLARWRGNPSQAGLPALRHPVYGAHICLAVGLPEEIAHIALSHSHEGEFQTRSLEALIIHRADHPWWSIAGACGLLDSASDNILASRKITPRALQE